MADDEVCIGDRYRIGQALFEVSQRRPRARIRVFAAPGRKNTTNPNTADRPLPRSHRLSRRPPLDCLRPRWGLSDRSPAWSA
jgi:hypothetical protein